MRVLLAEKDKLRRDAITIALEGLYEAQVTCVAGSDAAISALKRNRKIDLVVSSMALEQGDGEVIKRFLLDSNSNIPIALYGMGLDELMSEKISQLPEPLSLEKLFSIVAALDSRKRPVPRDGSAYCKVKLETLLFSGQLYAYDAYVKLTEGKFVKILNKGDTFGVDEYTRYTKRQLKYLYLKEGDFLKFLTSFTRDIESLLMTKPESLSIESSFAVSQSIHETLMAALPRLGMQEELESLVRAGVHLTVATMRKNPDLSQLLRMKMSDKSQFFSWHSTMLAYVSCWLSAQMSWNSDTTHYKLVLASYLHDVTLDNPKHSLYQTLKSFADENQGQDSVRSYLSHPLRAAELIRKMKDFPGDVDFIVAQHHERPDGEGFPNGMNHAKISPLAALFIISEDMVHDIYAKGKKFKLREFAAASKSVYAGGYFKKVIAVLEKIYHAP